MIRMFALAGAIACLMHCIVVAGEPFAQLSVVVADDATASLLPPLRQDARLSVLFPNKRESIEVIDSRALKLRFATYFVYCSGCETPISAMYRERLQNHGAVVIDLRTFKQVKSGTSRGQHTDDLSLANLFQQR